MILLDEPSTGMDPGRCAVGVHCNGLPGSCGICPSRFSTMLAPLPPPTAAAAADHDVFAPASFASPHMCLTGAALCVRSPGARRALWGVIRSEMAAGRDVLLTSHRCSTFADLVGDVPRCGRGMLCLR